MPSSAGNSIPKVLFLCSTYPFYHTDARVSIIKFILKNIKGRGLLFFLNCEYMAVKDTDY